MYTFCDWTMKYPNRRGLLAALAMFSKYYFYTFLHKEFNLLINTYNPLTKTNLTEKAIKYTFTDFSFVRDLTFCAFLGLE